MRRFASGVFLLGRNVAKLGKTTETKWPSLGELALNSVLMLFKL
ncbi:hypothetical protein Z946_873 [Sulfitobacter noctilucicola]|nr:hypothetical protein Z946_873 [Sulfitobacter noctilucicola]